MGQLFGVLKAVPLLLFVLAVYFLLTAMGGPGALDKVALSGVVPSGAAWVFRTGDLVIGLGLVTLFIELLKATRANVTTMIDQALSLLLFAACIVLFLMVAAAGTGTFLLLTVMSLVDVMAGFIITVSANRRDINVERVM